MGLQKFLSKFFRDEKGAVTVDFVVLVAVICVLGLVIVVIISSGATDLANDIQNFLNAVQV